MCHICSFHCHAALLSPLCHGVLRSGPRCSPPRPGAHLHDQVLYEDGNYLVFFEPSTPLDTADGVRVNNMSSYQEVFLLRIKFEVFLLLYFSCYKNYMYEYSVENIGKEN